MSLIKKALVLAGIFLAVSFGLTLAVRSGLVEGDTALRAQGVMAGLVLALCANLVPKTLEPLSKARCDLSRAQAVQRFTGWTLVLAGLGHSLAWLVLPLGQADKVAMALVAAGMVLVLGRVAWAFLKGPNSQPPVEL